MVITTINAITHSTSAFLKSSFVDKKVLRLGGAGGQPELVWISA